MSFNALLMAVRDEFIEDTTITAWAKKKTCGIRSGGGRPPGWAGQTYMAVVPVGWSPPTREDQDALTEVYGLDLVFTLKTGKVPDDRLMEDAYLKVSSGLEPLVRSAMVLMQQRRYTSTDSLTGILRRANNRLIAEGADPNYLIHKPLRWLGNDSEPTPMGPDWFLSDLQDTRDASSFFGWRFALHYGEAERTQPTSLMT